MSNSNPISNYLDIIKLVPNLVDPEGIGPHKMVVDPLEIRSRIIINDAEIRGILRPIYGSSLEITPYLHMPVFSKYNTGSLKLLPQNSGSTLTLNAGIEEPTAYEFHFISETDFRVSTIERGTMGTGDTSTDFLTSDGILDIDAALWVGTGSPNDEFYIKIYFYEPLLILLSSLLTAVDILTSVYSEQSPNASVAAEQYRMRYDNLMRRLIDGDITLDVGSGASGTSAGEINLDPIQVDYEINDLGVDVTNYADPEWPPREEY